MARTPYPDPNAEAAYAALANASSQPSAPMSPQAPPNFPAPSGPMPKKKLVKKIITKGKPY